MSCSSQNEVQGRLPGVWYSMIEAYIRKTAHLQLLPHYVQLMPSTPEERQDANSYLIPPIVVCSPLETYPQLDGKCPTCGKPMNAKEWTPLATSHPTAIRTIHGLHSPTLLISRTYKCPHGHLTLGHYSSILNEIPSSEMIPFQLSHKSGYTKELALFIYQLAPTAMSMRQISDLIYENRQMFFLQRIQLYKSLNTTTTLCPEFINWRNSFSPHQFTTSHSVIGASFIHTFQQMERFYEIHMSEVTLD